MPPKSPAPCCTIDDADSQDQVGVRFRGELTAPLHLPKTGSAQDRAFQIEPGSAYRAATRKQRRDTDKGTFPRVVLPVQQGETREGQLLAIAEAAIAGELEGLDLRCHGQAISTAIVGTLPQPNVRGGAMLEPADHVVAGRRLILATRAMDWT
jgi:hypothetical protein